MGYLNNLRSKLGIVPQSFMIEERQKEKTSWKSWFTQKWILLLPWCAGFHPCSSRPALDLDLVPRRLYSSKYIRNTFRLGIKNNPPLALHNCENHFLCVWKSKWLRKWTATSGSQGFHLFLLIFNADESKVEETEMCNFLAELMFRLETETPAGDRGISITVNHFPWPWPARNWYCLAFFHHKQSL